MERIEEVNAYVAKAVDGQEQILNSLRDLIAEAVPDVKEQLKWGQPVYATVKDFVYLKHTKKHVNLGFFNFEKVEDPNGLLEGTGKSMRHIKIMDLAKFDLEELKRMIASSSQF